MNVSLNSNAIDYIFIENLKLYGDFNSLFLFSELDSVDYPELYNNGVPDTVFFIDPSKIDFTQGRIYFPEASETFLIYKCEDWNSTTLECDGTWEPAGELKDDYIQITPQDPGFALIVDTNTVDATVTTQNKIVRDSNNYIYYTYADSNSIYLTRSEDDGLTWKSWDGSSFSASPRQPIESYSEEQKDPSLAIDVDDTIHIVWSGKDSPSSDYKIFHRSLDQNNTLSTITTVSSIPGYDQGVPSIIKTTQDYLHVVWQGADTNNTNTQIKYSFSPSKGETWYPYINIDPIAGYDQKNPNIAISNNYLYVVQEGEDSGSSGSSQIKFTRCFYNNSSRCLNEDNWESWTNIYANNSFDQTLPSIVVSDTNEAHVTFLYNDNALYTKCTSSTTSCTSTANWQAPFQINESGDVIPVLVSLDNNDQPVTLYNRLNSTTYTLKYRRYHSIYWGADYIASDIDSSLISLEKPGYFNSYFHNLAAVSLTNSGPGFSPYSQIFYSRAVTPIYEDNQSESILSGTVVSLDNGDLYALYEKDMGPVNGIRSARSTDGGLTWEYWDGSQYQSNPAIEVSIENITTDSQLAPRAAVDSQGNIHAVWYGQDPSNGFRNKIKYAVFNGTTWSAWTNIESISRSQYYPDIAIDSDDNLHVVWYGENFGIFRKQIKYSTCSSGCTSSGNWSSYTNIAPISGQTQRYPLIAIDSNDKLHVAWDGDDSGTSRDQIKYSGCSSGCTSTSNWSSWLNVSPISGFNQDYAKITTDLNDKLHIAWDGSDSGESDSGIKYSNSSNGSSWLSWVDVRPERTHYRPQIFVADNNRVFILEYGYSNQLSENNIYLVYSDDHSTFTGGYGKNIDATFDSFLYDIAFNPLQKTYPFLFRRENNLFVDNSIIAEPVVLDDNSLKQSTISITDITPPIDETDDTPFDYFFSFTATNENNHPIDLNSFYNTNPNLTTNPMNYTVSIVCDTVNSWADGKDCNATWNWNGVPPGMYYMIVEGTDQLDPNNFDINSSIGKLTVGDVNNITFTDANILQDGFDVTNSDTFLDANSTVDINCLFSVSYAGNVSNLSINHLAFFDTNSSTATSSADPNNNYQYQSCTETDANSTFRTYNCFMGAVEYYAVPGDWNCELELASTVDGNFISSPTTLVNDLIAFEVPSLIDFNILNIGEISSDVNFLATNLGNLDLNMLLSGTDMNCTEGIIDKNFLKYDASPIQPYNSMTSLSSSLTQVNSYIIPKRVTDIASSQSDTYWKLKIPPSVAGTCNGTVTVAGTPS